MTGIQYLTDELGRRGAVQIDLRKHAELWDEFKDVLVSNARRAEVNVSLESVNTRLALAGKIRD